VFPFFSKVTNKLKEMIFFFFLIGRIFLFFLEFFFLKMAKKYWDFFHRRGVNGCQVFQFIFDVGLFPRISSIFS